jgi:hypothetical protein
MIDTKYCKIESRETFEKAVGLARGPYQSNLILGVEAWYGRAKQRYGKRVDADKSRALLWARLMNTGLNPTIDANNRLILG